MQKEEYNNQIEKIILDFYGDYRGSKEKGIYGLRLNETPVQISIEDNCVYFFSENPIPFWEIKRLTNCIEKITTI